MTPWFERDPDRYDQERSYWIDNGFTESGRGAGEPTDTGTTTVRFGDGDGLTRSDFELRVTYPRGFPDPAPSVEFIDLPIRRTRHQSPGGSCARSRPGPGPSRCRRRSCARRSTAGCAATCPLDLRELRRTSCPSTSWPSR